MDLSLLLRLWKNQAHNDDDSTNDLIEMVKLSLRKMAYGGIFDHLAGGFARYSTDESWLVPHFEKMLYDNGLLAAIYFEMFRVTGDAFYAMIGRKTLDYLLNYMQSPTGGIFSTEDADSEGEEGKFYVWSKAEIMEVLGDRVGDRFCRLYNVTNSGNFEGHSILNMTISYGDFADQNGMSKSELRTELKAARAKLLEHRDQRIRPGLDDKILCSWNSLAIIAFCEGYLALEDERYLGAAKNAFQFIWKQLRDDEGNLLRLSRNGVTKQTAFLDDYAYLLDAIYSLYQTEFDESYVDLAAGLIDEILEKFGDQSPGFFFTPNDGEQLITRVKDKQDSSVPSGNSVMATALLKWGRLCGRQDWLEHSRQTIDFACDIIERAPLASGQMLIALNGHLNLGEEWVLVLPQNFDQNSWISALRKKWLPSHAIILRTESNSRHRSPLIDPVANGKELVNEQPTLYICRGFSCEKPLVGNDEILQAIDQLGRNEV